MPENGMLKRIGIIAAIVAVIVVAIGITTRMRARHALATEASGNNVVSVIVVKPEPAAGKSAGSGDGMTLPGNVQAYNSAPIFARTNGYVRQWLVDIGQSVHAGQTLAILDAPEVDQQLAQARANYQTAIANQRLAKSTAVRWQALLAKDAVSRQEADEKQGDLAAKTAVANAEAANVKRLQALYGFTRIQAPFAGVVTSRSAQIGQLVTAGTAASQPLFTVSDVRRVRVYVRVPQSASAQIHAGLTAKLTVPEYPGRDFPLTVTRTAGAVDPQSGTVLVELQAANGDRALKPGAYAQVTFPTGSGSGPGGYRLPASALMLGDDGATVAIVGAGDKVALKRVTIGRDEGKTVIVSAGLKGDERVIDTPPDAVENGDTVNVMSAAPAAAGGNG